MKILPIFSSVLLAAFLTGCARSTSDPDAAVLEQLKKAGSDLSKPHSIEFFLYFPTQEAANRAAQTLEVESFDVEVSLGADKRSWLCLAARSIVPTQDALSSTRERLEKLASELGGEYDGWGTAVVK